MFLWLNLDLRPARKVLNATASKIKKAMTSKRQRDSDDSDDVDYAPNRSEMAAASSVGDVGDESSEEETEGVEDDVTDLMGIDLPMPMLEQWISSACLVTPTSSSSKLRYKKMLTLVI